MNYLLDTNILIIYSRDSDIADKIEDDLNLFDEENTLAISIVSIGELNSLIKQLGLGEKRKKKILALIDRMVKIGLNSTSLIEKYGDIDAFSKGKLVNLKHGYPSITMGKNDIWIAATASTYDLTLVTTDKDFAHLEGPFIKLCEIDIEAYRA